MADQNGLQLLPETRKKIEIIVPGENRTLIIGSAVLVIIVLLAVGLYFYKNSRENQLVSLDSEITRLEQARNRQTERNLLVLDKQISLLSKLLDEHVYWTTALSRLGGLTQGQVQFDNLSASLATNEISFKATATNYTTIARQIAAFLSDEAIKDVTFNKVSALTNGRLGFDMQILFDRSKFLRKQ